ncbi:MAG: NAD-dependent epimerase/dehydratase family protein [Myxococcota bacterium]|nr:NAD-dependent epimerase/dehydratase family protein [Myxococcota bacterium]
MTVVVTGASGFIGSVLVRELLARGRSVRAVVHNTPAELKGLDVELVQADVRDRESLARAFAGAGTVFHLAAVISLTGDLGGRVTETNVTGARNAARAALEQGVGRFVHFSSIHAFDLTDPEATIRESSARVGSGHPIYDRTKAAGEAAVREVIAEGLDGVIVHPSGVLGPGDSRPSRIGQVLLDLEARRLPALLPGGFDWVDVRDVVAGALAAEELGRSNESYLLSGHWHSARELADFGAEVTGVGAPRTTVPMWLGRSLAPFGDFWGWLTRTEPRLNSDALVALRAARDICHSKAGEELGHRPRPIEDSVGDAYRWFSQAGMLRRPLTPLEGRA